MKYIFTKLICLTLLSLSSLAQAQTCTAFTDANGAPVNSGAWITRRSLHTDVQSFPPTSSSGTLAQEIFYTAISRLKTMLALYTPNDWDKGTISRHLIGSEGAPLMTLGIDLTFWPAHVVSTLPISMTWCRLYSRGDSGLESRRISFDLRRASGDFTGVIDGFRFDFLVSSRIDSLGYITVRSRDSVLPGANYSNYGSNAAELLRNQIFPLMNALREHFGNLHSEAERRENSRETAVATIR